MPGEEEERRETASPAEEPGGEVSGRGPEDPPGSGPGPAASAEEPETREGWSPPGDGGGLERIASLVAYLRERCPWDAAQTPSSLVPYFLEEAHEVVEAIDEGEPDTLRGELGDLLLHLAFQLVLAEEEGAFRRDEVVATVEEKMKRRHPHLFGRGPEPGDWEAQKAREREGASALEGLARGLDPLLRAHRIQDRVSGVGFDWDDAHGAWEKVAEELEEVRELLAADEPDARLEEEVGDLLFAVVNLTRLTGGHARELLRRANLKFEERFRRLEERARARGVVPEEASLETLDAIWEELKGEAQ